MSPHPRSVDARHPTLHAQPQLRRREVSAITEGAVIRSRPAPAHTEEREDRRRVTAANREGRESGTWESKQIPHCERSAEDQRRW